MKVEVTAYSAGLRHRGLYVVALVLIGAYKVDLQLLKSPHTSLSSHGHCKAARQNRCCAWKAADITGRLVGLVVLSPLSETKIPLFSHVQRSPSDFISNTNVCSAAKRMQGVYTGACSGISGSMFTLGFQGFYCQTSQCGQGYCTLTSAHSQVS